MEHSTKAPLSILHFNNQKDLFTGLIPKTGTMLCFASLLKLEMALNAGQTILR